MDLERLRGVLADRYEVLDELGRGGMAAVYLARDLRHERRVALKVMRPEIAASLGAERFLKEIRISANLAHPNILPLLLFFVMPYLEDGSLRALLRRDRQLPLKDALRITSQVADALEYAHARGIMHRDIKPENILFEAGHAIVADFGIARAIRAADEARLTETGLAVGSPAYMSPEQAEGRGDVDVRTDIYSLGCVLYEMLAGEPPFMGTSPSMIIARKMTGVVPPLRVARDSVPEALERTVEKAVARSPIDRFDSARQFADALVAGPAPSERRGTFARGLRHSMAPVLVTLALIVGGWWVFQTFVRDAAGDALAAIATATFLDSVAVLPVENRTGDAALDNVGAALSEGMAGELKRLGRIKVTDPYSVRHFVEADLSPGELADSLGVEKLVRGSLYRDSARTWVNVVTTEGTTRTLLWQETYELDYADAYGSAGDIALAFGEDYAANAPALAYAIELSHPAHTSGQEAYLLGKTWLGRRTSEGLALARDMFRQAITLDPEYGEAFAGLSKAHALTLAYRYRSDVDGYRAAGLALGLASRAIELEPGDASGYSARGYIATRSYAPPEEVAPDCERAIELAPGAPEGLSWCARVLYQTGQVDAGFIAAEKAIEIDPKNAGRRLALAYEALALGRYDRAIEEARAARAIQPELMLPRAIEARALLLSGAPDDCIRMDLGPHEGIRAMCLHALGQRDQAAAIVDSIAVDLSFPALDDTLYSAVLRAEDLSTYYAWTGDAELALAWLEYAFERSPSGVEARVLESALFARVAEDQVFREAIDTMRASVWARVKRESTTALP